MYVKNISLKKNIRYKNTNGLASEGVDHSDVVLGTGLERGVEQRLRGFPRGDGDQGHALHPVHGVGGVEVGVRELQDALALADDDL